MVKIKSGYKQAGTLVWSLVLHLHYLSMSVEWPHVTRNPTHTAHKLFLTEWTIWKYSSRFTCRDSNHPTPASGTWYLLLQYQHWLQLLQLFVRFAVSSRFDHQTRTVASAPKFGRLSRSCDRASWWPLQACATTAATVLRRNSLSCAWNTGISDGTMSC